MRTRFLLLVLATVAALAVATGYERMGVDARDEHGMTALMRAARRGDRAGVERLLARGADVNAEVPTRDLRELIAVLSWMQQLPSSDIGYRALHYAVLGGDHEIVRVLLATGADPNHEARGGVTALDLAIQASDLPSIELLAAAGARPTSEQLWSAVARSTPAAVALLLAKGASASAAPPLSRYPGPATPPLAIVAARRGDPAIVAMLARAGMDVNATDANGWTALRWLRQEATRGAGSRAGETTAAFVAAGARDAAGERSDSLLAAIAAHDEAGARRALAAGAVDSRDDRGVPAIVLAARAGDSAIVAALVQAGANVNVSPPNDVTPLVAAIEQGSVPVVRELLHSGARADQPDALHRTPMAVASMWRRTEITALLLGASSGVDPAALSAAALAGDGAQLRMLLEHGVDANANEGQALSEAARGCYRQDNTEAIRLLLDAGADPKTGNHDALRRAAGLCSAAAVQLLLAHHGDPNARDLNGWTALSSAVASGRADIVPLLIAAGADVNARDDDGKSILEQAARYPEVQRVLREAGARR